LPYFAILDPEAVQHAIAARMVPKSAFQLWQDQNAGDPGRSCVLTVKGSVNTISNGRYRNRGPKGRGVQMDMPTVVLDTGAAEIAVISGRVEPSDLNCLLSLGLDPLQKLCDTEQPHLLTSWSRQAAESRRRMCRRRRLHLRLQSAAIHKVFSPTLLRAAAVKCGAEER